VLREVVMSARQPIGLEPWGRMTVEYEGLDVELPWIERQARALAMSPGDLRDGVAAVLDYLRRRRVLRDPERGIFSQWWMDGDLELQQGYLPQMGAPVGTKLRRGSTEKAQHVLQWISERGDTTLRQVAKKWCVPANDVESFLEGLFDLLKDQGLLVPVTLKGSKGGALPGLTGLYQVDADRLRLTANSGAWRCRTCRRRGALSTRPAPHDSQAAEVRVPVLAVRGRPRVRRRGPG
jgi:hypothetical protein